MRREVIEELIEYRDSECCQTCEHAQVQHYESVNCRKFDIPVSSICICDHFSSKDDEDDNSV